MEIDDIDEPCPVCHSLNTHWIYYPEVLKCDDCNAIIDEPCPVCHSLNTHWIYYPEVLKCDDCNAIIDDDWYSANEPEIIKGKNYPENE